MNSLASEMKLVLNEQEFPEDLLHELEYDAEIRDMTVNDAATRVLSEHYELPWNPSGRRYRKKPAPARFKIRVSDELHRHLRIQAAENGQTIRGIVLHILSTHYETEIIDPTRRKKRRQEA